MSRIILLSEFFPPEHGGIQWSLEVASRLFGSELTVVAPPHAQGESYDQSQTYRVIRRSLFSGKSWPRWGWLVGWLRQQSPDLVLFGHFSAATMAAWLARKPYAILVHGRDLLVERRWPMKLFIPVILQHARWIGVNSTFTGRLFESNGVKQSHIIRTHPAVENKLLDQAIIHHDDLRLITVARLVSRKNIQRVIEAVAQLAKQFPKLQYEIVGDGPERSALETSIKTLGLSDRVRLHGQVSDQEKWELYRNADIGIMIPLIQESGNDIEGLGIFYLEAAAFGLPLIASETGGVTDIVRPDQTGLLVQPESVDEISDAIQRLAQDQPLRKKLGADAKARVQKEFTVSVRNHRIESLLKEEMLKNPPLISIIIPAYQSADTIGRTLDSLFQQTWKNYEIIIVDDGSTDDLLTALRPYTGKYSLIQQANAGAAAARNTGAVKATGTYLLFVDADTIFQPDCLTQFVVALETHPEASFAYSNFRFGPKGFHLFEFDADRLRRQNYIHTTSLIRHTAFPGFDPTLKKFQDWDLWLTMVEQGQHGLWLPRELFAVAQRLSNAGSAHQIPSTWLPSFVYKLPLIGQGRGSATIRKYREAEQIIRTKHRL